MIGITTAGLQINESDLKNLSKFEIEQLDVSITSCLGHKEIATASREDLKKMSNDLMSQKIVCNSLQSIFFGSESSFYDLDLLRCHIEKLIEASDYLSCDSLLLGSPKQRSDIEATVRALKVMDEICHDHGKKLLIENLDAFPGIWGQSAVEIHERISSNKYKSCNINFHVFLDEPIEIDEIYVGAIRSLHISDRNYSDKFLESINFDTLKKVKKLYEKIPSLCVEVTGSSFQKAAEEFLKFKRIWSEI